MATENRYRTVKLRTEVADLIEEVRRHLACHGTNAIRDPLLRERALLLEHVGASDVVELALVLLRDHVGTSTARAPKLGRDRKRG